MKADASTDGSTVTTQRPWRWDADADDNFWFVSDHPDSDDWTVRMTSQINRDTKTERPTKGFVNFAGQPRRNAWPINPFSLFGYVTIEVIPDHGEPFVAVTSHLR